MLINVAVAALAWSRAGMMLSAFFPVDANDTAMLFEYLAVGSAIGAVVAALAFATAPRLGRQQAVAGLRHMACISGNAAAGRLAHAGLRVGARRSFCLAVGKLMQTAGLVSESRVE